MKNFPTLDRIVLEALDLHASYPVPSLKFKKARQRVVIASGNALPTGKVLFHDENAQFYDESQAASVLKRSGRADSYVVISASGAKHAPLIVADILRKGHVPSLITCDMDSPAARLLPGKNVVCTKKIDEPITYNTSTYMGMMLTRTRENPRRIREHLVKRVTPILPDFTKYRSFYFIVPAQFQIELEMFRTKFDELFGGRICGRCYTFEQTMHAKTVVPWEKELFVSFGQRNDVFGLERLHVPLPDNPGFVAMLATAYFVVGKIQSRKPAWFERNANRYKKFQDALFEAH